MGEHKHTHLAHELLAEPREAHGSTGPGTSEEDSGAGLGVTALVGGASAPLHMVSPQGQVWASSQHSSCVQGKCPTNENQAEATAHLTVQLQGPHGDPATFPPQGSHQVLTRGKQEGEDSTSPQGVAISGNYKRSVPGVLTTSFQGHKCNHLHSDRASPVAVAVPQIRNQRPCSGQTCAAERPHSAASRLPARQAVDCTGQPHFLSKAGSRRDPARNGVKVDLEGHTPWGGKNWVRPEPPSQEHLRGLPGSAELAGVPDGLRRACSRPNLRPISLPARDSLW